MSNPTNQAWSVTQTGVANGAVILLDRWSSPDCVVMVEDNDSGSAVMTLEGTSARINRGETPVWAPLWGTTGGSPDANILYEDVLGDPAPGMAIPIHAPMEALRISISAGTGASGRVLQAARS